MGPMGELGALFNPGMRHELEERQAKASRREEDGNAKDGDLRIDLESGVAVINIPAEGESQTEAAGSTSTGTAATAGEQSAEEAGDSAESAQKGSAATGSTSTPVPVEPATGAPNAEGADEHRAAAVKPRGKRGLTHATR